MLYTVVQTVHCAKRKITQFRAIDATTPVDAIKKGKLEDQMPTLAP